MGKLKIVRIKERDSGVVHKIRVTGHAMVPYMSKQGHREESQVQNFGGCPLIGGKWEFKS